MYRSLLLRAARFTNNGVELGRRFASEGPPKPKPPSRPSIPERTRSRLDRLITRSPNFFKPTLQALRDAPASYIVSFAVLHELTAIVPLLGLFGAFHYYRWLPPYFAEGKWVLEGVEKFGRYFRKKGWIEDREEAKVEEETKEGNAKQIQKRASWFWNKGEDTGRILVEVATAYAIVKVVLPFRIMLSVWWAPAAARATSRAVKAVFRRGSKTT